MNRTSETAHKSAVHSLLDDVFGPIRTAPGTLRYRLLVARSVLAYLGLVSTLVQIVVWLMIAVITAHLDGPWWLWTTAPAAAGVVVLTIADRWHGWFAGSAIDPSSHDTAEVIR